MSPLLVVHLARGLVLAAEPCQQTPLSLAQAKGQCAGAAPSGGRGHADSSFGTEQERAYRAADAAAQKRKCSSHPAAL